MILRSPAAAYAVAATDMIASMAEGELLGWCVVANVGAQPDSATGALHDQADGTHHFSAGTKVWVLPPQWGDGDDVVFVLGRHRGRSGGLVRLAMPRRHLTGFKTKPVYSPTVMVELERP